MGKLLGKQHVRGLRSRWLRSGVLLTVAVVVLFTLVFSLGVRSYYYNAVRTGLATKAQSASTFSPAISPVPTASITRALTAIRRASRIRTSWSCSS